ncbi:putative 3-hydroxybutyrate dehydrogenase [Gonapodya prolifera JEL478]|uniref:3-oxoacyl-[acyl-carrier-protein] reductase n=1 Tax=Gonapodya prolifera (strain JEL478) TaxID=1344416 RepID=A0A139A5Z7_GONPJ|nr:putative 3-hydroxybutyrate dehydrogenase [Gonapodya prolifera JEL478]|eukprot:KXS12240.1 putative 3-hydroxybutyrate dehydrogenase [Gonapodya prolifera JEL478]
MASRLLPLLGHTALVTGAGSGIGRASALELARRGARVVVADLNPQGGEETVRMVNDIGKESKVANPALFVRADCSVDADLVTLTEAAGKFAKEGGEGQRNYVGVLVNNAGLQSVHPIPSFPPATWNLILSVLLTAPFRLTQLLLPEMYEGGWGRIINVGSIHSMIASEGKAAYISAKHGLVGLTKTTALEAAAQTQNVTCNVICPSYVSTPLVDAQIANQSRLLSLPPERVVSDVMCAPMPQKRLLDTEEVAGVVGFLCGEEARGINGAVLPIDGGWTAR